MNEKQWFCKCGAALGMIQWNGDGIPQLLVYRHAVDMRAEKPAEVEVLGPLMGRMPVECDVCSQVRMWWPSAQVILALLDMLGVDQIRQFTEAFLVKWKRQIGG